MENKAKYKNIWMPAVAILSAFVISCTASKRVEKIKPGDIDNLINSKNFTFIAERVNPFRGASRNLTSLYDVEIKRDTLICFLPFFGRAYQAPMDPSKGGIDFKSTNFSYNITEKSKDEWDIYIEPKDNSDVQTMIFSIFGNGNATLNIQNTHRDPISFYGRIEKNKSD
ncbi:MAG: DUF4251 domain-containing protein [Ginsengibacter sp.]